MRIFRDDGAGQGLGPSLSDILPDESKVEWSSTQSSNTPAATPAATPEKTSDLAAALEKQPDNASQESSKEADKTSEEAKKDPPADDKGLDTSEEIQTEAGDITPEAFYTAVDQLTGEPVAVEFGEIDPLSPEGVALRDRAVRADEVEKFEAHIKESDPRAYAYFMHRQQGGDDASFFEQQTVSLPDTATFQASVELQTQYYRQSLTDRGIDPELAEAQVKAAIKNNTLEQKAMAVYNSTRAAQVNQLEQMEQLAEQDRREFAEACNVVLTNLNTQIDSGSLKFIVPDAKKQEFKAFVQSSLRNEDGKFYAVQEINGSAKEVLESLYFAYVKGDLTSLVEKRANTKAVQRLKLGVQKASGGSPKGVETSMKKNDFVSLGDI